MDRTFTIELQLLRARSNYFQGLLLALPGDKICQLITSPPDELVKSLKALGHQITEGD